MNPDPNLSAGHFEHTPSLDDLIFTKREFPIRTDGIRRDESRLDVP
jgi:hypothetical protein